MRNNLIFTNIHEAVCEAHEQTEHKLREFLVEKCKIVQQGVNDIQFESVQARTASQQWSQGYRD